MRKSGKKLVKRLRECHVARKWSKKGTCGIQKTILLRIDLFR